MVSQNVIDARNVCRRVVYAHVHVVFVFSVVASDRTPLTAQTPVSTVHESRPVDAGESETARAPLSVVANTTPPMSHDA